MAPDALINHLQNLIAHNEIDTALQQLRLFCDNSPRLREVLQQTARYEQLQKHIRMGTVNFESATVEQNKIRDALLDLLSRINIAEDEVTLKQELKEVLNQHQTNIQEAKKIYNINRIDKANFS